MKQARIRLKKMKHARNHVFTVMTPRRVEGIPRVIKLKDKGDVSDEMPSDLCYEIAGLHPECLEVVMDEPMKPRARKAIDAAPENK